jgi:hypothetical protein
VDFVERFRREVDQMRRRPLTPPIWFGQPAKLTCDTTHNSSTIGTYQLWGTTGSSWTTASTDQSQEAFPWDPYQAGCTDTPVCVLRQKNGDRFWFPVGADFNVYWGEAVGNWQHSTPHSTKWVDVYPYYGTASKSTNHTVRVRFPPAFGDPNVTAGALVGYIVRGSTSRAYAVYPPLDAKIGTLQWRAKSVANPWDGWGAANGSANSTANGGSGIDYTGAFIREENALGFGPGTTGQIKDRYGSTCYDSTTTWPWVTALLYERLDNSSSS